MWNLFTKQKQGSRCRNKLMVSGDEWEQGGISCETGIDIYTLLYVKFLHWSPVAYWAPTDLGSSSFSVLSFGLFMLFMGFSRQEYWSGLPFLSPVDHILSDLSTMTHLSWVAPWPWLSSIESDKAVVLVWLDWLVFCEYGFSVFALWCPLATPTILLGFLLPWMWGISSRLL